MNMANFVRFVVCLWIPTLACASQPSFQQKFPYFFEVKENPPNGHLIGYVNASVANSDLPITYETSTIANGVIRIDNVTGALNVNGTLDADIDDLHDIQFSVYAYIVPNEKASIKVYVIIIDVNDNAPVFQNLPYKVNITEDFPINTFVTRIKATDVDRKGYSELIYGIQGWTKDSIFIIKEFDGTIWTNKRIDYEKQNFHLLNVTVTDGRPSDTNRHLVYTAVEIFISDFDDQGAKFDQYNYHASIEEGMHNFTKLIQLHASDLDKGINAPVAYSIYQDSNPGGIYRIDSKTGLVTAKGIIDREAFGSSFYLTIQATSTMHEPATATVLISINDTNDNSPFFPNDHQTGSVLENSLSYSKIMQAKAVDLDEGLNKELEYHIKGGDEKFIIDSDGFILVNGSLDREVKDSYSFEVHVVERFTKEMYSNKTNVTIFIQDVNDNSPKFEQSFYEFEVEEEINAQLFISQLNATDDDFGANGLVIFSIIPDAEGRHKYFHIDQFTGKLSTRKKLDRESINRFSILIKATDQAKLGQRRETLSTVKVIVTDVNDNVPYFPNSSFVAFVNEAANVNTIVLALQAEDRDIGANAKLEYEIAPSSVSEYFKIDKHSGIIKTAKNLDRETISSFSLHILVTDGGNKSSSTNVIVFIIDVNDNAPVFTSPTGYEFNVTEGKRNEFVGVVQAFDLDQGDAGKVKYMITNNENFNIDSNNGTITTAKELDREAIATLRLTVVAEDQSVIAPRNSYSQVEIAVLDLNDNAPVFPNGGDFSTVIRKDSQAGTFVYRFLATDTDYNQNGEVTYVLPLQYQGAFSLENATGILRINSPISNYTNESLTVNIFARDNGSPSWNTPAKLHIYFANILKSAPIFEKHVFRASIKENAAKGTLVVDANAKFNGKSDEKSFRYSIVHGDTSAFEIQLETGKITTKKSLDREAESKYILVVMVQLRLEGEANFATVVITLDDENDSPPKFLKDVYKASLYENQRVNTTVISTIAVDEDEGVNSRMVYALKGSDDFHIDVDTGEISTKKPLDCEKNSVYSLTVTAVNEYGSPKLNSTCRVEVNVLDVNDNAPKFEKDFYNATVFENSLLNTSVIQVKAHDKDKGINGYVKYDIMENDCFFIEWQTGIVKTTCLIDREQTSSFELVLIAKSVILPLLSSTAKLNVRVIDVDDNHPHFASNSFRLDPIENLRVGSLLMKLNVSDADSITGNVSYHLHAGNDDGYFSLNEKSGSLILVKQLDREVLSEFTLEIRAYSLSHGTKSITEKQGILKALFDQAIVRVIVQDVNDNVPYFVKNTFVAAVPENAKFKSYVTKVYANDSDIGDYGSLAFSVESGNQLGLFYLDRITGIVTVYKSLIGEAGNVTSMVLLANDNKGIPPSNPSSNKGTLRIYVTGDDQTGVVLIETTADYLHSHISFIETLLGNCTNSKVTIDEIKPIANKNVFRAYFHAIDQAQEHILNKDEIRRLILNPSSKDISAQLRDYNITWYFDSTPNMGKFLAGKETTYEIYVGIIAAIAILLIITCAFAIWAAFFKKDGYHKEAFQNDTRTNTMESTQRAFSVDTRSSNRYVIEAYESQENVEQNEEIESIKNGSALNGSQFYTVESHEDFAMENRNEYLDSSVALQLTQSWAYGDIEFMQSQDDTDDMVAKATHFQSGSHFEIDIENQEKGSGRALKDTPSIAGPLLTSERMDGNNFKEVPEIGMANEEEETCGIDSSIDSVRLTSCDDSSKQVVNADCNNTLWSQQYVTSDDPSLTCNSHVPISSPSYAQFESKGFDFTDASDQNPKREEKRSSIKNEDEDGVYGENKLPEECQPTSFVGRQLNKTINEHVVSCL